MNELGFSTLLVFHWSPTSFIFIVVVLVAVVLVLVAVQHSALSDYGRGSGPPPLIGLETTGTSTFFTSMFGEWASVSWLANERKSLTNFYMLH